jgi:hypothetical protein
MLLDFSDFELQIDTIPKFEFDSFFNDIKNLVMTYSETELKDFVKSTFEKTKSFNYNCSIKVKASPPYCLDLKNIDGFNPRLFRFEPNIQEQIDSQIINRVWYTGDACMSAPANIFYCKATLYSCLMDSKLYYTDITQLKSLLGNIIKFRPYNFLAKFEGGINFDHLNYTYWNKLVSDVKGIYYRPYFELIGSDTYHSTYIPIHDLIIFCKVLEKEGAHITYNFEM